MSRIEYNNTIISEDFMMDKTMLEKYTNTFGSRFTRAQKNKFLKELHADMGALGYTSTNIKGKKFITRAENYLFGNIKQVKTIVVVPYDTPEKKFWHKVVYYPMDGNKTTSKTMLATYVPLLVLFAILIFGVYFVQPQLKSSTGILVISFLMFALTMLLVYIMLHGIHNKHNANRNSATIAQVIRIATKLTKDERKKVGFLFTDKNRLRFLGAESSVNFLNKHSKNPTIICLDCLGVGTTTRIGFNPQNRKLATEIAKSYPEKNAVSVVKLDENMRLQSAMSFFRKAVIVSSGDLDEEDNLYVMGTGTGKDTLIDDATVDKTGDMIYTYIHTQK